MSVTYLLPSLRKFTLLKNKKNDFIRRSNNGKKFGNEQNKMAYFKRDHFR